MENMTQTAKAVLAFRMGKEGDLRRPLGWKNIAKKVGISYESLKLLRRSQEYYDCVLQMCKNIGAVRLQAHAARKNRSVDTLIKGIFGTDMYDSTSIAGEVDYYPLPSSSADLSEEDIEILICEADKLVIENTQTIGLTRKHVKWLAEQGYSAEQGVNFDRFVMRASAMTRAVCSHKEPDWLIKKKERNDTQRTENVASPRE